MSRADNSFAFAFNKIAPPENTSPEALRAYNNKINRAFEEIYERVMGHLDEKNLSPKTRKDLNNKVESKELDKYTLLTQTEDMIALEADRVDGHFAEFTLRADQIDAAVQAADGRAVQAQITADGASVTASNAAGTASQALQTAEAFSWRLALGAFEARIASEKNNPDFPDNPEYGLYLYLNNSYYGGMFVNSMLGHFGVGTYQKSTGIFGQTIYLQAGTGSVNDVSLILGSGQTTISSHFLPNVNDTYNVGSPGYRFKQGFWTTAANVSSDIRIKRDVAPLDALALLDRLIPFRYRLKEDPRKLHFGFIAQSVQDSLRGTGLEDAALLADEDPDHLGLCYEELIAVLVEGYQKQQKRIADQDTRIEASERRLAALEGAQDDRR